MKGEDRGRKQRRKEGRKKGRKEGEREGGRKGRKEEGWKARFLKVLIMTFIDSIFLKADYQYIS
jgi:flagellar biosynthesis/type III secretory pathway protein FliH